MSDDFALPENIDVERPSRFSRSRYYYWILATDPKTGKAIILGAYESEENANQVGFTKLEGGFEVVELPTRDIARATKMLKYKRFHQRADLEEALKRAKHQI